MGRRALILGRGTAMQKHTSGAETNIPAKQMPRLQQNAICPARIRNNEACCKHQRSKRTSITACKPNVQGCGLWSLEQLANKVLDVNIQTLGEASEAARWQLLRLRSAGFPQPCIVQCCWRPSTRLDSSETCPTVLKLADTPYLCSGALPVCFCVPASSSGKSCIERRRQIAS